MKEKRRGPIGRAAGLAEGVAATVRRMQRDRERPVRRARGVHAAALHLDLHLLGRVHAVRPRRAVHRLEELRDELGERAPTLRVELAGAGEGAGRVDEDGRAGVGRELAETRRGPLGSERARHRRHNSGVPLPRISWLATVGICLIAALLLLLDGYYGYSLCLLAVGASAAVNVT